MNPLLSLLKSDKPEKAEKHERTANITPSHPDKPHLDSLSPPAAMPGGEIEVLGHNLGPAGSLLPYATIGDIRAYIVSSRSSRLTLRIPEGTISGDILLHRNGDVSNSLSLRVAVPMAENLHPVANPAVDADGNIFVTFSGSRGQQVPVSIFSIQRDLQIRPFIRELLNPTGLAFGPDGHLYCSSRAEGIVYRISPTGTVHTYAEGLGIATGLAFDREGNLFVGDRTGTIFKITPPKSMPQLDSLEEETSPPAPGIFVHATLEPSIAAYHLAFNSTGTLFVTGPTTSSNQAIYAIDPHSGSVSIFYQGLGRAQGMAFDVEDNLYVAASLHGQRGIIRITPGNQPQATLAVSGQNIVGLAFLEDGCAALATHDALYHIDLGIDGLMLPKQS